MFRYIIKRHSQTKAILRYSTSIQVKEAPSENTDLKESLKQSTRISKLRTIIDKRKPQRPPFVKNLFTGEFDYELLAYPEALEKDNIENLFTTLKPLEEYFKSTETNVLASNGLTRDYTTALGNLQLMGLKASQFSGGKECNVTEACLHYERIMECGANNNYLAHELLGLQILLKYGNKQQQDKYLDGVSSGRIVTGLCVTDPMKLTDDNVKTKAVFDKNTKTWTLNGAKSFVINGNTADLLVVLAETDFKDEKGLTETGSTAFFVDKSSLGVSPTKNVSIGLNGLDIAEVKFDSVVVSHENVISQPNQAEHLLRSILPEYRLSTGPALITLSKKMCSNLLNWIKDQEPTQVADYTTAESIYMITSQITKSIYAMESMTYFTSGLLDNYIDQDCEIEAAIVRIFSAEQTHKNILSCLEIIGSTAYLPTHWSNQIYRDATTYLVLNEPIKSLKLSTALLGLQHAGIQLQELIKSVRNPMFFPMQALKRMLKLRHHQMDNPKMVLGIKYHLHPSLNMAADAIEYCVLRLNFATEMFFSRYGNDIITKHNDLERLANVVVDIYAMITCAARASRSYCIGLQHADQEILLASAICLSKRDKVSKAVIDMYDGSITNMDDNFMKIGKKTIKEHQYYPVHPLTRNF